MIKNYKKLILSLVIGFIAAILILTIFITIGYNEVYSYNLDNYDVMIMGLKIYDITKINGEYIGKSVDYGMGIVTALCMLVSVVVSFIIKRDK